MSAALPAVSKQSNPLRPRTLSLGVFAGSLIVYSLTLAPTVTLVDSGELILAARSLGVAHPPGFPLYVLLAHLATLVPIGNVAVRVNFASAVFAALAGAVVTLLVGEIVATPASIARLLRPQRKRLERKARKRKSVRAQDPIRDENSHPLVSITPLLVAGLLLAFSRTVWAYATIAEVYTLNTLLIATIFLLMFRWRRGGHETRRRGDAATRQEDESGSQEDTATRREPPDVGPAPRLLVSSSPRLPVSPSSRLRLLYAAAFLFGLALGVHHVTVGLMLPALAALVWATEGVSFFISRRLLYAALFSFAGLFAVYAYLPIAASRAPIMNWGDTRTLERLWWHITGKQYQVFLSYSLHTAIGQFVDFIKLAAREFGPAWLPIAPALFIAGMFSLFKTNRTVFWFLALVIIADLAYALGYDIAEDKDAYYLPAFIAMAIGAGFGTQWLVNTLRSSSLSPRIASLVIVAVMLLVPFIALAGNLPYNNRSRYYIAQDYTENILSTVASGGMLLTRDWQVYSPMLYVREIERRRDDAVVIDINQLRRSWYYQYLERAYPATIEQARDKVDAFLEDLRHWEEDPDLYQQDLSLNERINTRFFDMISAFITNHIRRAPVYVTLDIAGNRDGQDSELTKSLAASYQFVPQGLIFQVLSSREFQQTAEPQLLTRGLVDGTLKFDDDDVVKLKVLPVYITMFYNRGRYLAVNGHHDEAISAFKQALALDPKFTAAQRAISESTAAIQKAKAVK